MNMPVIIMGSFTAGYVVGYLLSLYIFSKHMKEFRETWFKVIKSILEK